MDSERRTELVKRRHRLAAKRNGEYRAFEEGLNRALALGFNCVRMENSLAELTLQKLSINISSSSCIVYETTDLDFDSCIEFLRTLLAPSDDSSFAFLKSHGAPPVAAISSKDAMAEMAVPMLSHQDDVCVVCLSDYSGLNIGISHEAYGRFDAFSIKAWGTMEPVLLDQIAAHGVKWFKCSN
jgi:hypothetical protein